MKKILLYFATYCIIQIVCSLGVGKLMVLTNGEEASQGTIIILSAIVSSIVTLGVFLFASWTPVTRTYLSHKPIAATLWTVVLSLGMLIPSMMLEEIIPDNLREDLLKDVFMTMLESPWGYLHIAILAPIVEEVVFRGAIQRAAERYFSTYGRRGSRFAIALSATLFAVVHGNPAQIPHAMVVGIILGWMCHRSGSIVPGIILHFINNSMAFLLYHLYPQSYDMSVFEFFGNSISTITVIVLCSLYFFFRGGYMLNKIWSNNEGEAER